MKPLPADFSRVYFRALLPAAGWPTQFAIVTAHNPEGQLSDESFNRAADAELQEALTALGHENFRVTGGSEDGKHQEPGWGILLATPQGAQDLCVRFRQLAFFWVDQGRLFLVDARTGESVQQAAWVDRLLQPQPGECPLCLARGERC